MKKILPPQLFYFSIVVMLVIDFLYPIIHLISFPYNLTGIFVFIAGVVIAVKGKGHFQKVGTNIPTFNEPDVLVTDGLYKYSRNPMYLGFAMGLFGIAVLLGSISAISIVIIFMLITDRWYINFEEKMLLAKFREEYAVYKMKIRRWI